MTFHPLWPLAVITLVAVAALAMVAWRSRTRPRDVRRIDLRRLGMAVIVLLIAVRPVFGGQESPALASDVDVVLLVDRTTSMAAEDHEGGRPRLSGVAHDIGEIANKYPGARFALVTFTSKGFVEMPFTTDTTALVSLGESIQAELYLYSRGSSISAGIDAAKALLEEAATDRPGRTRHLIYLGDGEQTSSQTPASFAPLKGLISGGAVLGYGSEAGGRMANGISKGYVTGRGGRDAVSKVDLGNLRQVADQLGVKMLHRTRSDKPALDGVGGGWAPSGMGGSKVTSGTETYWMFALALVVLALWELWDAATAHRRLRAELAPRPTTSRGGQA